MSDSTNLRKGKVKFYIDEKLYGFLNDLETDKEIYIPVAGLIDEIRKNNIVTYREAEGGNGVEAVDVRVVKR